MFVKGSGAFTGSERFTGYVELPPKWLDYDMTPLCRHHRRRIKQFSGARTEDTVPL